MFKLTGLDKLCVLLTKRENVRATTTIMTTATTMTTTKNKGDMRKITVLITSLRHYQQLHILVS